MIPTYIVDDVSSDRYIARRRLTKAAAFAPIREATDGVEFIASYLDTAAEGAPDQPDVGLPDLVLLDINMPEMDGFETLEELKRHRAAGAGREQIVALFSSSDNERDKERSRASGIVDHFFTKPIDDRAIGEILETYRARGLI